MELLDESGEIRATAFRDLVDKLYPALEVGKVYYIKGASVKPANRKFNSTRHNYELTFEATSTVVPCAEEQAPDIPTIKFEFNK